MSVSSSNSMITVRPNAIRPVFRRVSKERVRDNIKVIRKVTVVKGGETNVRQLASGGAASNFFEMPFFGTLVASIGPGNVPISDALSPPTLVQNANVNPNTPVRLVSVNANGGTATVDNIKLTVIAGKIIFGADPLVTINDGGSFVLHVGN